jgi:hypothetical protein
VRQGLVRPAGLFEAMVCAGLLAAGATPLRAAAEASPAARLDVALTVSMTLPDGVRDAAMREVEGIWRREGVHIHWTPPGLPSGAPPSGIRVMVVSVAASTGRDGHDWAVAELLRDDGGRPIAIASVASARRVLDVAGVSAGPAALVARRLGVVLGRAVAHEIGHYLLNTTGHARHGLMRARIDARDFADLRNGGFGLEADAALWARASLTRAPADALRLARFVHTP